MDIDMNEQLYKANQWLLQFTPSQVSDMQKLENALTKEQILQVTMVPLVIGEICWVFAFKAVDYAAKNRIQELKPVTRLIREQRESYERKLYKHIDYAAMRMLKVKSSEFANSIRKDLDILFYTTNNEIMNLFKGKDHLELLTLAYISFLIAHVQFEYINMCNDFVFECTGARNFVKVEKEISWLMRTMAILSGKPNIFDDSELLRRCVTIIENRILYMNLDDLHF